jgi:hypothetical protein
MGLEVDPSDKAWHTHLRAWRLTQSWLGERWVVEERRVGRDRKATPPCVRKKLKCESWGERLFRVC